MRLAVFILTLGQSDLLAGAGLLNAVCDLHFAKYMSVGILVQLLT